MYDIAIIGAGPAGSNLARLIGNKYKVLLIDKRDFHNEKGKCCGGLLAPDAQKMIAKLGLGIPKDILVDPQLFAVKTIDLTNNLERLYQRFYFNIDRLKFDKWLVSLIPSSVDISYNSVFKSLIETPNGNEITYMHNGKEISTKAKVIVGADGAFSKIRNIIKNDKTPITYISIQEWFTCSHQIPYYTAIFDEEISEFYSWIIPKDNYLLLGSALKPKENPREKYDLLKLKLSKLGYSFDMRVKTEGAYIYRPKRISQLYAGKNNVALIGEAAGAISPSSAEGISYALKSSLFLAESLEDGIDGFMERYKNRLNDIKFNLFLKNLKSPVMYNPFLRKIAMKSGIQSIK